MQTSHPRLTLPYSRSTRRSLSHSGLLLAGALRLAVLALAFLNLRSLGQSCLDISGDWNVTETVTIVQIVDGDSESQTQSGSSTVRVTQNGCQFQFTSKAINPLDGSEISLPRQGVIKGTNVTFTGIAAQPAPGVSCPGNQLNGTGYILGNSIYFSTKANFTCSAGGVRATITIDGNETFRSSRILGYTLRGEVRSGSASGRPLAGVAVALTGAASQSTTTDATGSYRFTGLVPGDYRVSPASPLWQFSPTNASLKLASDAVVPPFIGTPSGSLAISRIWSAQLANPTFNQLPAEPDLGRGAGTWGNATGLVVCGAGADGLAHLQCLVQLSPDDAATRSRAVVRLVRSDASRGVLAPAVWDGNVASFSSSVPGEVLLCEVEGWLDLNANAQLDTDLGEVLVRAPGSFAVVSREGYTKAIQQLRAKTWHGLAGAALPIAYRLLDSFLDGHTPAQAEDAGLVVVSSWNDLDHNMGVNLGPDGVARVHEYRFGPASDVAEKILASDPIRELVAQAVAVRQAEIASALAVAGSSTFTFSLLPAGGQLGLDFPIPSELSRPAWDLYFAFHGVSLRDAHVTVYRDEVGRVDFRGAINDLYDFRWNVGELSSIASRVQAGFPTLGLAGGVYRLNIELSGPVLGVNRESKPWLRLLPPGASDTMLVAELIVLPHARVSLEVSSNLVDWRTLTSLVPTSAVTRVQLPIAAGLTEPQFFRAKVEASSAPPTITTHPVGVTATTGDPVELHVVAVGADPLKYQWTKNDQPILDGTGSSYRIPGVQLTDDAVYRVVVSNPFGTITSEPAAVHVLLPVFAPSSLAGGTLNMVITNSTVSPIGSLSLRRFTSATAFSGTKTGGSAFSGTYTYSGTGNTRAVETVELTGSTPGALQRIDLTFTSPTGGSFALSRPPATAITSTGTFVWEISPFTPSTHADR